jgi:DNA-binding NarL/FixJ family response regulator
VTLATERDQQQARTIRPPLGRYRVLVELCRDGASNREIGRRLYVTEHTVKCHIKRMLAETGYRSRLELAVAVLRRELIVVPPDDLS